MYGRAFGTFLRPGDNESQRKVSPNMLCICNVKYHLPRCAWTTKISPNALCISNVPKARPYMVACIFARFHIPTY